MNDQPAEPSRLHVSAESPAEPGAASRRVVKSAEQWSGQRILFVTGRLAEPLVRQVVETLRPVCGFEPTIEVLGISVAALMHADWVRRKLDLRGGQYDLILLPGWTQGDIVGLADEYATAVRLGPKDVRDLPDFFGAASRPPVDLSRHDIEIVAEINHAPRLSLPELISLAARYRDDGADVIDLGCIPGETWRGVGAATAAALVAEGHRISIDSFDRAEVEAAVAAGAELVLSCNRSNRDWAAHLPAELVAIPDDPADLDTLDDTIAHLRGAGSKFRIDPILEPVGYGFAASIERYRTVRSQYPELPVLMGIGNVTELAQVDSAGLNFCLAAMCQEWGIESVLTTEVAPWCRSAIREFDLARRLVRHALEHRALVKGPELSMLMLRDRRVSEPSAATLTHLATGITDPNIRIFLSEGQLHLINRDGHWASPDPYEVFDKFLATAPRVDATHAFYLGYELAKATTAMTLGKQYTQDAALDWGPLTRPEVSALHRRREQRSAAE
ncbi:MAG: DUF6513 domain-containing protein [Planctomycetaceae bacterium]